MRPSRQLSSRLAIRFCTERLARVVQPSTGYLGIRQAALMRGVNALEPTISAAGNVRDTSDKLEPSQRRMLNELLPGSRIELMPRS